MSDSLKVAFAVCVTVLLIAVVAAITSVTLTHGDTGVLIRNLGLVAAFLVAQIPVLINQIRARDKAEELTQTTKGLTKQADRIEDRVNGTLGESVHDAVVEGMHTAAAEARAGQDRQDVVISDIATRTTNLEGRDHGDSGSVPGR
jgi:hypothetical protein